MSPLIEARGDRDVLHKHFLTHLQAHPVLRITFPARKDRLASEQLSPEQRDCLMPLQQVKLVDEFVIVGDSLHGYVKNGENSVCGGAGGVYSLLAFDRLHPH